MSHVQITPTLNGSLPPARGAYGLDLIAIILAGLFRLLHLPFKTRAEFQANRERSFRVWAAVRDVEEAYFLETRKDAVLARLSGDALPHWFSRMSALWGVYGSYIPRRQDAPAGPVTRAVIDTPARETMGWYCANAPPSKAHLTLDFALAGPASASNFACAFHNQVDPYAII